MAALWPTRPLAGITGARQPNSSQRGAPMYRPFDLTGKVVLVTGGNSGIGLGMARAVAEAGADVAIWGTNAKKNAAARAKLAASERNILALECDVSDEKAVDAAFAETLARLGRVDGCFANA